MTKNRINKIKRSNPADGPINMKGTVITIGIFLIICVGMYYLTELIINRENTKKNDSKSSSEIVFDYSKILFTNLTTRPYTEYYVLAVDYDNTTEYTTYYQLITTYKKSNKSLKVYYIDLSDPLNLSHVSSKSHLDTTSVSDLVVSKTTLIHIKDGKILNCYEDATKIKELLK